ncbi:MAG: hypothetical protein AB1568_04830 [Thermodesulfobacteriota bacterium]
MTAKVKIGKEDMKYANKTFNKKFWLVAICLIVAFLSKKSYGAIIVDTTTAGGHGLYGNLIDVAAQIISDTKINIIISKKDNSVFAENATIYITSKIYDISSSSIYAKGSITVSNKYAMIPIVIPPVNYSKWVYVCVKNSAESWVGPIFITTTHSSGVFQNYVREFYSPVTGGLIQRVVTPLTGEGSVVTDVGLDNTPELATAIHVRYTAKNRTIANYRSPRMVSSYSGAQKTLDLSTYNALVEIGKVFYPLKDTVDIIVSFVPYLGITVDIKDAIIQTYYLKNNSTQFDEFAYCISIIGMLTEAVPTLDMAVDTVRASYKLFINSIESLTVAKEVTTGFAYHSIGVASYFERGKFEDCAYKLKNISANLLDKSTKFYLELVDKGDIRTIINNIDRTRSEFNHIVWDMVLNKFSNPAEFAQNVSTAFKNTYKSGVKTFENFTIPYICSSTFYRRMFDKGENLAGLRHSISETMQRLDMLTEGSKTLNNIFDNTINSQIIEDILLRSTVDEKFVLGHTSEIIHNIDGAFVRRYNDLVYSPKKYGKQYKSEMLGEANGKIDLSSFSADDVENAYVSISAKNPTRMQLVLGQKNGDSLTSGLPAVIEFEVDSWGNIKRLISSEPKYVNRESLVENVPIFDSPIRGRETIKTLKSDIVSFSGVVAYYPVGSISIEYKNAQYQEQIFSSPYDDLILNSISGQTISSFEDIIFGNFSDSTNAYNFSDLLEKNNVRLLGKLKCTIDDYDGFKFTVSDNGNYIISLEEASKISSFNFQNIPNLEFKISVKSMGASGYPPEIVYGILTKSPIVTSNYKIGPAIQGYFPVDILSETRSDPMIRLSVNLKKGDEVFVFLSSSGLALAEIPYTFDFSYNGEFDSDFDGFSDNIDVFPYDPKEYADINSNGIGDNVECVELDSDGNFLIELNDLMLTLKASSGQSIAGEHIYSHGESMCNVVFDQNRAVMILKSLSNGNGTITTGGSSEQLPFLLNSSF